jgi:PAS domain S-box-containing protein
MIEAMILKFNGHQSPYFMGMVLTIIYAIGFLPLNIKISSLLSLLIYSIYFSPIIVFDTISNKSFFISINVFIVSIIAVTLLWRFYSQKRLISELGLQYDLDQKKKQLEVYSQQLEDLVAERTKELSISEQRYRELFENANDGIVVFDKDRTIFNVNQKFCELHSFEKDALIGKDIGLLEVENTENKINERMSKLLSGEAFVFETEHKRKDGGRILLEISSKGIDIGGELYIQSFHRDITEKKRLQAQLFQSQKMESVGLLAGGIAHDFNNILTAILGHTEILHEFDNLDVDARQRVKIIENSARRAGQLVSQLLSFARKSTIEILPINLNAVIRDTVELLDRVMAKKNVQIKMDINENIPTINGDNNQLEQVIMNLLVNAGDAMPEGGDIIISTSLADLEKGALHVHPLLKPGKYVVLKISDKGTGIPEEIKDRIFDPFFTTKELGKGTGLGLAMVYGIVKELKGIINLISHSDTGTTFEIYLPATESATRHPVSHSF